MEAVEPVPGFNIDTMGDMILDPNAEEGPVYDYKMKKIAQLAKKVRTTTVKLNTEMAKNEMLTNKLAMATVEEKKLKKRAGGDPALARELAAKLKKSQKEFREVTSKNKVLEFKVSESGSKIKKLERALRMETGLKNGENLNLAEIMGDQGVKKFLVVHSDILRTLSFFV